MHYRPHRSLPYPSTIHTSPASPHCTRTHCYPYSTIPPYPLPYILHTTIASAIPHSTLPYPDHILLERRIRMLQGYLTACHSAYPCCKNIQNNEPGRCKDIQHRVGLVVVVLQGCATSCCKDNVVWICPRSLMFS